MDKTRKYIRWLCSACDDEVNAPVASTVHRGRDGENSHAATLP